ncbi:MAG: DNA cytosine methyltransferase [Acidimicrobiales bacterium]
MNGRPTSSGSPVRVAALFAGIGGIELGLSRSKLAAQTELLCEWWQPAQKVLGDRIDAELHADVRTLGSLPESVDMVTAGFPCNDLSQAGRTAGIGGAQSGLVSHVFDLLGQRRAAGRPVPWLVIENVANMLALDRGEGMRYLVGRMEDLGYRWAYRTVDSRFTGVPQRRRRVLVVASPCEDPRAVLFGDDAGEPGDRRYRSDTFGFYWTEGLGGLGWARDAVPTLKGGSTVGIPSPPAIWVPDAAPGRRLVLPLVEDAEALQGFPRGWTSAADLGRRNGPRWKLVGNAVTVGVARWLGDRIAEPGDCTREEQIWTPSESWPKSAWGGEGKVFKVDVSEYPRLDRYRHLRDLVDVGQATVLSARGARGFWSRLERSNLGRHPGFRDAVAEHVALTRAPSTGLSR